MRRLGLLAVALVACASTLVISPALGMNLLSVTPSAACTGASCTYDSPWAGWGVHGKVGTVNMVLGSWVQPTVFTCPTQTPSGAPAKYSESIGVGLNLYSSGRMDGVGTLGFCVDGVAFYAAWFDQAPAPAVLIPLATITPAPGNIFNASVSCFAGTCHYFLEDQSTAQVFVLAWGYVSLPLNLAECVVMKGTALGVLPAAFAPLPPSAWAPGDAQFGSLFTGFSGCMVSIQVALVGFGAAPPPLYVPVKFTMSVVPVLSPTPPALPLLSGLTAQDSFTVA